MKRCPTCQKTFADTMRFCQIDGTPLVEDIAPPTDPFKTIVSGTDEMSSMIPPVDPFKTMIGGAPPVKPDDDEDDLLQLGEPDPMRTMINPATFGKEEINFDKIREDIKKDIPPPAPSAPKVESKSFGETPTPIPPPKSNEPNLNPPSFGSSSTESSNPFDNKPPKFDSNPLPNKPFNQSPFDNPPSGAIPSPFDLSMPPRYQTPTTSPFGEPEQPKQYDPTFREVPPAPQQNAFDQFQNPPPMGQQMQQTDWTPPPAPEANWQNQNIGANTPFQPPAVGQGGDKTLAIVALVCGILSLTCCGPVTGIAALITGFMAKNNVDSNPNRYDGRGMALAGMIMGGISIVFTVIWLIFVVIGGAFRF